MRHGQAADKHPKGLYVLFATEMWERFSFYSMLAMFTLYLRDTTGQGFGWTSDRATTLYANLSHVRYLSPLVGGWLADRKLGYRKAVMIGGVFFMAGHLLLSIRSIPFVYVALSCLVIGNGFFQAERLHPRRQSLSRRQPPEGSRLQHLLHGHQRGRLSRPGRGRVCAGKICFHPAFAVAADGMAISVFILWKWKHYIEGAERSALADADRPPTPPRSRPTRRPRA